MTTFFAAAVLIALAISGMAIGVLVSNRRLKGTCGGLGAMRDEHGNTLCDACTNPSPDCTGAPLEPEPCVTDRQQTSQEAHQSGAWNASTQTNPERSPPAVRS